LFWFIAGALVGATATLVAIPLWRGTLNIRALALGGGRMRFALAGAFVATFAAAAAIIYFAVGSRHSLTAQPPTSQPLTSSMATAAGPAAAADASIKSDAGAKSMETEVAALEARLARDGGTSDDWTLLAKAYEFLGRPADAARARSHTPKPAAGATVAQMSAGALVAAATATETRGPAAGSAASMAAAATPEPTLSAAPAQSPAELEKRVKQNPRDVASWLALAELHRVQHDDRGARDALAKVIALHGMTAQSWADYADVLASLAGGSLAGDAGRAIDSALALDPTNLKALWLKASQAHEQRHFTEALAWWRKLRAALPSDAPDARVIDANILEDTQLAGLAVPAGAAAAGAPAAANASGASGASGTAEVSGTVSIDSRLAGRVQRDATLFIYAKAADSPGPPLAVLRTTASAWPVSFHLDDSMAMIPSRRLSQFDKVVVEARISRSGQATPSAGDLYVTSPVLHPAAGQKLALVINREIG
jgi:cytochrome c-type biogenesis protein CcmH